MPVIDFDIEKGRAGYSLKTLRTIFYFLIFIVFLGRLPYLKLISYILLSSFAISMLILED